jgi:AcrR family transcriptional regulator
MSANAAPRRSARRDRPTKGDRRERALIEAAQRLLGEGTFEQASVTELAKAAGLSRAGFYFYFVSKQALLASVIDEAVEEFNARIAAQLAPAENQPPTALIRAGVEAAAELWWEHRTVLLASVDLGAHIPEVYERTMNNVAVVRAPTVALLQRHGQVPEATDPDESERLVTALILMTERNFYDLMRTNPTRTELLQLTERLTRIWQRAFGLNG